MPDARIKPSITKKLACIWESFARYAHSAFIFNEMLDYIGDVPDDDSEDKDYYSDYDMETSRLADEMKSALEQLIEMNV